ncbi:MAG: 30S ribosomal protein S14 [Simkaniaceae bacterium]|nr:30S ribosomal protein S14 [Simkaniaceae bacterium]
MARKAMVEKERKRSRMAKMRWEQRQQLKATIRDPHTSEEEKGIAIERLNRLPKNSSPTRGRNRCLLTGRCRGYLRKFRISRLCFRELANSGNIPGVVKTSW